MESNKKFLNPESVLFKTGLNRGEVLVDLGAGSGFFALAAAKMVGPQGHVYVVDILEKSLEHVASEARLRKYSNIKTIRHDLEKAEIASIATGTADLVVVANLFHQLKNAENLMSEVYRILKTSGKVLIIDWHSKNTVLGPKASTRIPEEYMKTLASKFSLKFDSDVETDESHYGLIFNK